MTGFRAGDITGKLADRIVSAYVVYIHNWLNHRIHVNSRIEQLSAPLLFLTMRPTKSSNFILRAHDWRPLQTAPQLLTWGSEVGWVVTVWWFKLLFSRCLVLLALDGSVCSTFNRLWEQRVPALCLEVESKPAVSEKQSSPTHNATHTHSHRELTNCPLKSRQSQRPHRLAHTKRHRRTQTQFFSFIIPHSQRLRLSFLATK